MGFELVWLVEQQLDKLDPHLNQTVQRIVSHYCRACQQAAASQGPLEVYRQLVSLEQHPGTRRNRAFGEQLLVKLAEAGLVTASASAFLAASVKERQRMITEALNEAASKDQAAFGRIVREVLYNPQASASSVNPAANGTSANASSGTQTPNSA